MLREFVYAILPSHSPRNCSKKTSYADKANFRKKRENGYEKPNAQQSKLLDNVKTRAVKTNLNVSRIHIYSNLISFLIFYMYLFNVIITCDDSVNKISKFKERSNHYRSKNLDIDIFKVRYRNISDNLIEKNFEKSNTTAQDKDVDETSDKYSPPEVQELSKYYSYYNNKEDTTNDTENNVNIHIARDIYDDLRAIGYPHDLATNPFFVKKTNFNLRPEVHQFNEKILKLGVLLPADSTQVFSLAKVLPIVEMAIQAMTRPDGPLPGWKILVDYRDTRCSSVEGPLAAFEFYVNGSADAFIGPGCEYVIAPVARYAGSWGIPVITAGAQAEAFGYKNPSYMTLTRMMGSYTQAGVAIRKVFEEFNWRRLGMLYHNNDLSTGKGNSPCFMTLSAVFSVLQKKGTGNISNIPIDETNITTTKIKELLQKLSLSTRSEY